MHVQLDGIDTTLGHLVDRAADRRGVRMPAADMRPERRRSVQQGTATEDVGTGHRVGPRALAAPEDPRRVVARVAHRRDTRRQEAGEHPVRDVGVAVDQTRQQRAAIQGPHVHPVGQRTHRCDSGNSLSLHDDGVGPPQPLAVEERRGGEREPVHGELSR